MIWKHNKHKNQKLLTAGPFKVANGHLFMLHKLIEKLCQLFLEEYIHNFLQILLGVSQGIFVYLTSCHFYSLFLMVHSN